jgi:hypothetical protein
MKLTFEAYADEQAKECSKAADKRYIANVFFAFAWPIDQADRFGVAIQDDQRRCGRKNRCDT